MSFFKCSSCGAKTYYSFGQSPACSRCGTTVADVLDEPQDNVDWILFTLGGVSAFSGWVFISGIMMEQTFRAGYLWLACAAFALWLVALFGGRRSQVCAFAAFVVCLTVFAVSRVAGWAGATIRNEPFAPYIRQYMSVEKVPRAYDGLEARISGKVVVVNVEEARIDDSFRELPPELRAAAPQEVRNVALVRCKDRNVGAYQFEKASSVQIVCDVAIVDTVRGVLVAEGSLEGSQPPTHVYGSTRGKVSGSRPTKEIASFIQALHR